MTSWCRALTSSSAGQGGVFRSSTKAQLPNLTNLDPELLQRAAGHDPGTSTACVHVGHDRHRLRRAKVKAIMPTRRWTAGGWCSIRRSPRNSRTAASRCWRPDRHGGHHAALARQGPEQPVEADLQLAEEALLKCGRSSPDHELAVHRSAGQRRDLHRVGYSATSSRRATARRRRASRSTSASRSAGRCLMWFDTLAIRRREAPRQRAPVHRLPAAPRSRRALRLRELRQRQCAGHGLVNEELRNDPGIYPSAETKARLQPNLSKSRSSPPAQPFLDPLHDRP